MAKVKTHFVCQECGAEATQWGGKCFECGAWNSLVEFKESKLPRSSNSSPVLRESTNIQNLQEFSNEDAHKRLSTGYPEVDRVLGGGLLWNSLLLLGGVPGIGKSTLLLQLVGKLSATNRCLIVSGEESGLQVAERAKRLGLDLGKIQFYSTNNLEDSLEQINKSDPQIIVIDSVQTLASNGLESSAGTVSQIREVAQKYLEVAKGSQRIVLLVGHVTKEGTIAGPKLLEHMVDGVFYFESLNEGALRILRAQKNRFGSAYESAVFEMSEDGLHEVSNPSAQFLAERQTDVSGTAVAALVDGTRCFLVEVQALVQRCFQGFPRRTVQGVDQNRVSLLLAVLEKFGIDFANYDVYVKVAAGARIDEAAADLAIASALASARLDKPLPSDALLLGELSLTGGVRSIQHLELRLLEASRMGFKKFFISQNSKLSNDKISTIRVRDIREVNEQLWKPKQTSKVAASKDGKPLSVSTTKPLSF